MSAPPPAIGGSTTAALHLATLCALTAPITLRAHADHPSLDIMSGPRRQRPAGSKPPLAWASRWLGIETTPVGHPERLISVLGGFAGLLALTAFNGSVLGHTGTAMIVASMGSSAVLLFAVPLGALSQPWSVIAGHTVSAIVGVSCAKLVAHPYLAAALATGLSIGAMYYLRALHPPGGATALTAVVGGQSVHDLGFQFVVTPVLENAIGMVVGAILFNALFSWRRYPLALHHVPASAATAGRFDHEDFIAALRRVGSFIDVSEEEFRHVLALANEAAQGHHLAPERLAVGRYYSNGAFGSDWEVRQIVDSGPQADPDQDQVIWRAITGPRRNTTGVSSRGAFGRWAAYEVARSESTWHRVDAPH